MSHSKCSVSVFSTTIRNRSLQRLGSQGSPFPKELWAAGLKNT